MNQVHFVSAYQEQDNYERHSKHVWVLMDVRAEHIIPGWLSLWSMGRMEESARNKCTE